MPVDELPAAPDPATDTPQAFNEKAAAMVLAQRKLPGQINATVAEMKDIVSQAAVIAAGGAFAIPYVFDATTTDADPGAGKLRLSSATQNAATVMRLDLMSAGQDYTALIDTFDDSTSTVKGSLRLVKQGDMTKWMTFNLTALATATGYRNLTVVCTDSSVASPFANGDPLMLSFQRTGDKGNTPLGGAVVCLVATTIANAASINYLNLFTSEYDHYLVEFSEFQPAVLSASLQMRLAVANAAYAGATYSGAPTSSGPSGGTATAWAVTGALNSSTFSPGVAVDILNTASSNSPVRAKLDGLADLSSSTAANNPQALSGLLTTKTNSVISGFQLYMSSGNIAAGKLRVYGFRNQTGAI